MTSPLQSKTPSTVSAAPDVSENALSKAVEHNFVAIATPLIARGLPVIPLRPNSKVAILSTWPDLATTDAGTIAAWAEQFPNANIAVVAGEYALLDWDNAELRDLLEMETGQKLPVTFSVRTPGRRGVHDYFRHTERSRAIGNLKRPGEWDLQARRKYVVGPGSTINGKAYVVICDAPIADFPDWLLDWLVENGEAAELKTAKARRVPADCRKVVPAFDLEAFLDHYDLTVEDTRGNWYITDFCPIAGHKHEQSQATGFYYDGETLGFNCFASGCPGARMSIGDVVRHLNKPNGSRLRTPYPGPIWTDAPSQSPQTLAEALEQFNREYCYVNSSHAVVQLSNRMVMRAMEFRGAHAANRFVTRAINGEDGATKVVKTAIAKAWLEWPERRQVERMVYEPGKREFFDSQLNRWTGWGCSPKAGDMSPWDKLLDNLFRDDAAARRWFEQWCAYPLQNPGVKLSSAVILWGTRQGTGKTTVGETLGRIYGRNFSLIREEQLHAPFNDWSADKQFILADEITGSGDKRAHADRLKLMVTGSTIYVNKKFEPPYTLRDSINYLFTSNHCDAFFLEDSDRRYFVWEVNGPMLDAAFFNAYYAWLNRGGPSTLFHKLLHLDLTGFQPFQAPPRTAAKEEMVELGWSELDRWVRQVIAEPEKLIAKGGHIWTPADLLREFHTARPLSDSSRVKEKGMAAALKRAGLNSERVQVRGRLNNYCYALAPDWRNRDTREWAAEWCAHHPEGKS